MQHTAGKGEKRFMYNILDKALKEAQILIWEIKQFGLTVTADLLSFNSAKSIC
jgi:hypothetical protein